MWYLIGFAVAVVLFLALRFYGKRMSVNHLFSTLYMSWLDKTGSVEVALRKGLENFTYRAPFNQLNETEITHLIKTFSNRTEPRLLGMALQLADSEGSAIPLKDPEFVEKLADELMKRHS